MDTERTRLWVQNLEDERDGVALYEGLASIDRDPARSRAFRSLAEGERRHAAIWEGRLEREGVPVAGSRPSPRVRALLWLARRLGTQAVLPFVVAAETVDADKYTRQGAAQLVQEEEEHRAVLERIQRPLPADARSVIARRERWHRLGSLGGSLRAAVFGMNDGIVSNLSLVLGVAAAGVDEKTVIVAGVAGLLAGAFSMAAGEYVSVASQHDVWRGQVEMERRELRDAPEEEAAELALLLQEKGLSPEHARSAADEIMSHPETALDTLVREELGLDPTSLGSPLGAAVPSFALFAVGALLPLLPFLLASGRAAGWASAGLGVASLAAVGGGLGFLSGTGAARSALRMVAVAVLAVGITTLIGRLLGVSLS